MLLPLGAPWVSSWGRQWRREEREERKLEDAREARGRAAAPGTPALSRLLPGGSCPRRVPRTWVESPRAPRLTCEWGALTRKAVPARLPAAAAPRRDKGSLQPVLQPQAREQGASERRWCQPPDAARSAVPTRLSVRAVERVFLTSLMTPQPLQRTDPKQWPL